MPLLHPPLYFFQRHNPAFVSGFDPTINRSECFFIHLDFFFSRSELVCGLHFTHAFTLAVIGWGCNKRRQSHANPRELTPFHQPLRESTFPSLLEVCGLLRA